MQTADAALKAMKSGHLSDYDALSLALRRCAMGTTAIEEYESGQSQFSQEDLTKILEEDVQVREDPCRLSAVCDSVADF